MADRPEYDFNPYSGWEQMQPEYDDQFRAFNFTDGFTCHLCESKQGHYKVQSPLSDLQVKMQLGVAGLAIIMLAWSDQIAACR